MKRIKTLMLLLLSFVFVTRAVAQTEVVVQKTDGTTSSVMVSDQGKIFFNGNDMIVEDGPSNATVFDLADIRKVQFVSHYQADVEEYADVETLRLYPNPAQDYFKIASQNAETLHVELFSIAGQKLWDRYVQADEAVDISDLTVGFYIVKVNESNFKLCKR